MIRMSKVLYEAPSVAVLEVAPCCAIATSPPVSVPYPGIKEEEDI